MYIYFQGSRWLELDDLKPPICSWSDNPHKVSPSQVHIIVLQKATLWSNNNNSSLDQRLEKHCNPKDTEQENISSNDEVSPQRQEVTLDIVSELHSKLKVSECHVTPSHKVAEDTNSSKSDIPNKVDAKVAFEVPIIMDRKSPCLVPPSLHLGLSGGSFIGVALKRLSNNSQLQSLLPKKRRTLLTQFQPYVPKKERSQLPSSQLPTSLENEKNSEPEYVLSPTDSIHDQSFDSQSDSGYSSPSSVSSCGSTSSGICNITSKEESVNIADQLEKLLPDCLDNTTSINRINEPAMVKEISNNQDDFIRQLLFND